MQKNQMRMLALGLGLSAALAAPSRADAVRRVDLDSNDIVFDARTNAIYASVPGSAGARGNTLTPIDPATAALGNSVFVGSEPKKLAISGGGEYVYVGLDGAASVCRFNLTSQTAGLQFPLGSDSFLGSYYVDDMEVIPGSPGTVAISLRNRGFSPRHEGVALFVEGVQRPVTTPDHTGSNVIEFGSPTVLYGYNNETTDFGIRKMSVSQGGVAVESTKSNLISGFNVDIRYDNGRLYSTTGAVIDPEAGTLLGTFPDIGFNGNVRPDSATGRVFFVTGRDSTLTLKAYDMRTFTQVGSLPIPGAKGSAASLIRWGSDGLAFRTDGQVFIVQSSLVGAPTTPGSLSLSVNPASISETSGAAAATGTLTRTGSTALPLTVQLASSNASEARVPASVTIPAGASSATFAVAAVDDDVADGDQAVSISASAAGLGTASASLTVTDDEVAGVALTLSPSTWSEGAGASASVGTVTRSTSTEGSLVVLLESSNLSLANVPQFVTIPAGQRSATFAIATTDDSLVNGNRRVAITALPDGLPPVTAAATVTDNDAALPSLQLSISPSVIDENAGSIPGRAPVRGRVARATATPSALAVRLSSSDLSELRVPPVVVIPANQTAVEFTVVPVDDLVADGPQSVTVTAQAAGQASRSVSVTVRDNEVAALSVSVAPARIAENGAATVIVRRNTQVNAATPALNVLLSASPVRQVSLPSSVTIPAGASGVAVRVSGIDNALADGPRLVTISARASGLASGQAPLTIVDNEAASNLSVSGRVLGQAPGSPSRFALPGVLLTLKNGSATLDTALTASNGAYAFRGLPRGQYQIVASKAGATLSPPLRFVAVESQLPNVDFVATLAPRISGTVVKRALDGGVAALANAVVTARTGTLSFNTRTNSAGAFVLDRLPLGLYTVSVTPVSGVAAVPARTAKLDAASHQLGGLDFTLNATAPRTLPSTPAS